MTSGASDSIILLFGQGNGSFSTTTSIPTGRYPISIAVGDLDADNQLDLVAIHFENASIGVSLGRGDGTFHQQTIFDITPY